MMLVILLGAPGVGKGTQAKLLVNQYNLAILSTGEILRKAVREKTKLGMKVKDIIDDGCLVSDEVVCHLIENEFKKRSNYNGFILDGFPRTVYQANVLNTMSIDNGFRKPFIISLNLEEEEIIKRLSARIFCKNCDQNYNLITNLPKIRNKCDICHHDKFYTRRDDKRNFIKIRLTEYMKQTRPLIKYYSGYIDIDANQNIKEINNKIIAFIKNK